MHSGWAAPIQRSAAVFSSGSYSSHRSMSILGRMTRLHGSTFMPPSSREGRVLNKSPWWDSHYWYIMFVWLKIQFCLLLPLLNHTSAALPTSSLVPWTQWLPHSKCSINSGNGSQTVGVGRDTKESRGDMHAPVACHVTLIVVLCSLFHFQFLFPQTEVGYV